MKLLAKPKKVIKKPRSKITDRQEPMLIEDETPSVYNTSPNWRQKNTHVSSERWMLQGGFTQRMLLKSKTSVKN